MSVEKEIERIGTMAAQRARFPSKMICIKLIIY